MSKQRNNPYLTEQIKRLENVFEYLNMKGITQARVIKKIQKEIDRLYEENKNNEKVKVLNKINAGTISEYKNGKRKTIPDEFLEILHKEYNINPRYIRQESDLMLITINSKLKAFDELIKSWETVEKNSTNSEGIKESKKYLHIKMDKNFYDFMLEYGDTLLPAVENGIVNLEDGIKTLEELFESKEDLQEFVLVPCKEFKQIVTENIAKQKYLHEVIDLIEHSAYADCDYE